MLNEISYGRKDVASETLAGDVSNIPNTSSNFRTNLKAKGFDDSEIVALAAIEAFGVVWDPKKKDTSKFPKLDNYYFKQLLTSNDLVLHKELTGSKELKDIVDKYASDQKAFHDAFGKAFIKLSNLGHEDESLTNVENLLENHPFKKFIDQYY